MASGRDMSPELALVCPELAESLRAALPDRPWELFAPPAVLRPPRVEAIAPRGSEPLRPGASRRRHATRVAAVLAVAGIVAVAALADGRELPKPTKQLTPA